MKLVTTVKWTFYLLAAMGVGILLALPRGARSDRQHRMEMASINVTSPIVEFGSRDYRTDNGKVAAFSQWIADPLFQRFERRYPPSQVTPSQQRSFYWRVLQGAERKGELNGVIEGCAMRALTQANAEEIGDAQRAGFKHTTPATLLIYAERAEYFGQDVWCFLCLSTADHKHGSLRVMVVSCAPAYGLIHTEKLAVY